MVKAVNSISEFLRLRIEKWFTEIVSLSLCFAFTLLWLQTTHLLWEDVPVCKLYVNEAGDFDAPDKWKKLVAQSDSIVIAFDASATFFYLIAFNTPILLVSAVGFVMLKFRKNLTIRISVIVVLGLLVAVIGTFCGHANSTVNEVKTELRMPPVSGSALQFWST